MQRSQPWNTWASAKVLRHKLPGVIQGPLRRKKEMPREPWEVASEGILDFIPSEQRSHWNTLRQRDHVISTRSAPHSVLFLLLEPA